jgi:uncharacterized protein YgfB (UPF0149 family)
VSTSDYPQAQRLFSDLHAVTDPAEAHGTLAGALCAANDYRLEDWAAELLPEDAALVEGAAALRDLYQQTRAALNAPEMPFDLLIPDDEEPLEARTAALGQWCNGFLYGLGTNGDADPARLPGDAGEVVRDLNEITRAAVDMREDAETNEAAYTELVEFVRVGVQLIFEQLNASRPPPQPQPAVLH